jgi:S1-C subfamily serine protease
VTSFLLLRSGVVEMLPWRSKMANKASESSSTLLSLSNDLANAVERAGASVVAIYARERIPSSGVIWKDGTVVTAAHTIKREDEINVLLPDGRTVAATLAGRDRGTDIAVLKLAEAVSATAEIGDASELKIGNFVLAVGRPSERGVSASFGVVSAIGGQWRTWSGGLIDRLIRLDMGIYDGFSGSPLVDAQGRIVGINSSGLARGGAMSIPASTVSRVADELLSRGSIARPYIGVSMQPVRIPDTLKDKLNLKSGSGVVVLSVEPGGPADKAGMLLGDVLIEVEGTEIRDTRDVQAMLTPDRLNQNLNVTVLRGGAPVQLTITVGERPQRRGY